MIERRRIGEYDVSRFAFGTATFARGRLRPNQDSEMGIATLRAALDAGVNAVHSNPPLETQWAVAAADRSGSIAHMLKVELPLDAPASDAVAFAEKRLQRSVEQLNSDRIACLVAEADRKRTSDHRLFTSVLAHRTLLDSVRTAARNVFERCPAVFAFAADAEHMRCLRVVEFDGYASIYNLVQPWAWQFLDAFEATGTSFLAMSPLHRGRLISRERQLVPGVREQPLRLQQLAMQFVAGHPAVSAIVAGPSTVAHLDELMDAFQEPLPRDAVALLASGSIPLRPEQK